MNGILLFVPLTLVSCKNLRNLATFDFTTFYDELIDRHNTLRNIHSAPPLTKDTDIAKLAQNTADICKASLKLGHSGTSYNGQWMGQNLYASGGIVPKGADVTNLWYLENNNYDYATGEAKNNAVVGHFTQLVWKSSTKIGCAVAQGYFKGFDTGYYICCNYFPGGNILGQYINNVLKPIS